MAKFMCVLYPDPVTEPRSSNREPLRRRDAFFAAATCGEAWDLPVTGKVVVKTSIAEFSYARAAPSWRGQPGG